MSTIRTAEFDGTSLIVTSDAPGEFLMIAAGDPACAAVRHAIYVERVTDFTALRVLIEQSRADILGYADAAESAVKNGAADPEYAVKHGDPIKDVVLRTAIRVARAGVKPKVLAKFTARLEANPSPESRSQLFAWLQAQGLALTKQGLIVGYKGVSEDYRSLHTGQETVELTLADGTVEHHTGKLPYPIGSTMVMDRSLVTADRNASCSVGLHVGSLEYARSWGPRVLMVLVDPADVVAVPKDCNSQKMRVSKLHVAMEVTNLDVIPHAVISIQDGEAVDAYRARPENALPQHSWPVYDEDGYDENGFDEDGYDENGCDAEGYNEYGYDLDGFDQDGFDENGYDRDGFNAEGFDRRGRDWDGYDRDGFNAEGYDRDGKPRPQVKHRPAPILEGYLAVHMWSPGEDD